MAVGTFVSQGTSLSLGKAVGEALRGELAGARGIVLVERARIDAVAREHRLALSGVVDPATAVRLGELTRARYVLSGAAADLGGLLVLSARLADVETKGVILSVQATSDRGEAGAALAAKLLASEILEAISGKNPPGGRPLEDYRYYLYEALARFGSGDPTGSLPWWEKMNRASPKNPLTRFITAAAFFQSGRTADALLYARQAAEYDPSLAPARLLAGKCLILLSEPREAERELDAALAIRPDLAEAWFLKGQGLKRRKRLPEASECLDRAIRSDPRYLPARLALGELLLEEALPDRALPVLEEAVRLAPENGDAHFLRGIAWALLGEEGRARSEADWLRGRDPARAARLEEILAER